MAESWGIEIDWQAVSEVTNLDAAVRFLPPDHVLEVIGPPERVIELLGVERAARIIGIDKVIAAQGLPRVIEQIGSEKFIETYGEKKLFAELLARIPKEERNRLEQESKEGKE